MTVDRYGDMVGKRERRKARLKEDRKTDDVEVKQRKSWQRRDFTSLWGLKLNQKLSQLSQFD